MTSARAFGISSQDGRRNGRTEGGVCKVTAVSNTSIVESLVVYTQISGGSQGVTYLGREMIVLKVLCVSLIDSLASGFFWWPRHL